MRNEFVYLSIFWFVMRVLVFVSVRASAYIFDIYKTENQ